MTKKIILTLIAIFAPFLLIWGCWLITLGSFDYKVTFRSEVLWFFVIIYWVVFLWMLIWAVWEDD